jgi:hypothetical protein
MNRENYFAIMAMSAIVITIYALRNAEAHYLPDLLGLALALAAPRQGVAIVAWVLVAVVRHSPLALGLATIAPPWLIPLALPGARDMSISADEAERLEQAYDERISPTERIGGNSEISQPVAENLPQIIASANAQLMAKAVLSGAMGLTEAVRIASGAKSGRRYQVWSRQIRLEMERQTNHYHDLDQDHRQVPPPPR